MRRHFAVHIMSALHQRRQHGGNDGDSREDSRRRRRRRRRSSSNLPNGKEKEPPTLPKPSLKKQKRVEDKRRRRGKHHQQIRKNVFWSLLFAVAIAWNGMARNAYRSIASRLMRSDVVVVFTSDELENNLAFKSRWRSVRRFQRRRDVLRRRERVPFFYRQRSNERVF